MDPSIPALMTALSQNDRLWFLEIIIGLSFLIAINWLLKKTIKQIRLRSLSGLSRWQENLDYILYSPLHILLWILGLTLIVQVLEKRFDFSFFSHYIVSFRSTALITAISWVLLRWKSVAQKRLLSQDLQEKKIDIGLVQVISKLLSFVIILLTAMLVLQIWGLNIVPLLAFGGIGAATIGFAAKDVLANLFGGAMLHINRPFIIGDDIRLPSSHIEGHVEEIGWNMTTIRDKDKRALYLPNSTFSHNLVINSSRMTHRRIHETLDILCEDFTKLHTFIPHLRATLSQHPDVDRYLPVLVVLNKFGVSGLSLLFDFYTLKTRYDHYMHSRHTLLTLIYEEMQKADVHFADPTLRLSGEIVSRVHSND